MHPGQKLKPGARVRFEGPAGVLDGEVPRAPLPSAAGRSGCRPKRDTMSTRSSTPSGTCRCRPTSIAPTTPADRERYQTVYARDRGSVAAPTAGLHFTPELLADLDRRGVERAEITLHVGYGTFKPVRVDRVEEHVVDPEPYEIGERCGRGDCRGEAAGPPRHRRRHDDDAGPRRCREPGRRRRPAPAPRWPTAFIYPGHTFQVIDGLLTNFHLPQSSLLMLVAAFAGRERVLAAYREAVEQRYRFYSYGDAMLIT